VIVVAAVSLSGCSALLERLQLKDPTPTPPGIYMPITSPTPAPTPVPSATSGPIVIKPEPDSSVIIYPWPAMDYKMYSWDRTVNGQRENITFILENKGSKPAKNVIITLSMKDGQTGTAVGYEKLQVGDLARGEQKIFYAITSYHTDAYSIIATAKLSWGEYSEYFNPAEFGPYRLSAYA
jgi:hypothetical protein